MSVTMTQIPSHPVVHGRQGLRVQEMDGHSATSITVQNSQTSSEFFESIQSASHRVPLEVQEAIIGFLPSGSAAALSAALVCRSWYPSAMVLYYGTITLHNRNNLDELASRLIKNSRISEFLAGTHTAILFDNACSPTFPLVCGRVLPSLATLEMHNLNDPLHPSFFRAMSQFSAVTCLKLVLVSMTNVHQLRRLISALPNLKALQVVGLVLERDRRAIQGVNGPYQYMFQFPVTTRLSQLVLNMDFTGAQLAQYSILMDWLITGTTCKALTILVLYGPRFNSPHDDVCIRASQRIDALLHQAGPSLQELTLPKRLSASQYDLSSSINLTHIHFELYIPSSWRRIVDELRSVLSTVVSPHLSSLEINWVAQGATLYEA
ncbi:hypothetical protein DAEQUDRAFT_66305 [Daedalea quercina L-15889]|uniref:F-box domain-containing protein n=1 Tax=Daedalea quercina L-15889 TaxID=1314783 RepID=A0A165L882_9APHY|nr:hypothetical protein DAEQUDRAFT_66305 [Daedalea quercina L-15889]